MFGFDIFPKVFSCSFLMELLETVLLLDFSSKAEIFTFFLFTVFPNFYFSPSTASITFCFKTFIYDSGKKNLLRPSDPLSPFLSHYLSCSETSAAWLESIPRSKTKILAWIKKLFLFQITVQKSFSARWKSSPSLTWCWLWFCCKITPVDVL